MITQAWTQEFNIKTWSQCKFLTCSVLPVRVACNCDCKFCFSKSSISTLKDEVTDWKSMDLDQYFRWARANGATRLVATGGGEPLLKPEDTLYIIQQGRSYFNEIALFTNGSYLTNELTENLKMGGLSYICYSRHHFEDKENRELMGEQAPLLEEFFNKARGLKIRATCVMAKGFIDTTEKVWQYIEKFKKFGIREFTFKHTYVAYKESYYGDSSQNQWAKENQIEYDPFDGEGKIIAALPWGPKIRKIDDIQVCYYYEPDPNWERRNLLCRSTNLLSNGKVYASLEDQRSQLFQLNSSRKQ